jgi:hypothetical protein
VRLSPLKTKLDRSYLLCGKLARSLTLGLVGAAHPLTLILRKHNRSPLYVGTPYMSRKSEKLSDKQQRRSVSSRSVPELQAKGKRHDHQVWEAEGEKNDISSGQHVD